LERLSKSGVKFATANPSFGEPPPACAQGYGAAGHSKARFAGENLTVAASYSHRHRVAFS